MQQLHPDPFQLLIFILNSSQLFAALYLSGSRFQTMLPQNERDSFPYLLVLVLGSWRRLFILKLYGSIFRLKNSHRKEGLPEVIHLYTSNISFSNFFTCIVTSSFLCKSSSKLESKSFSSTLRARSGRTQMTAQIQNMLMQSEENNLVQELKLQ